MQQPLDRRPSSWQRNRLLNQTEISQSVVRQTHAVLSPAELGCPVIRIGDAAAERPTKASEWPSPLGQASREHCRTC